MLPVCFDLALGMAFDSDGADNRFNEGLDVSRRDSAKSGEHA